MTQHSQSDHEHAELIRRLEQQGHLFGQAPKLITQSLAAEHGSAYDKLFLRAKKIDSDGRVMEALQDAKRSIATSLSALYALYFLMALFGVTGLLAATSVNFFYLIVALLGWHTLSLLWWCISAFLQHRPTLLASIIDKISFINSPSIKSMDANKKLSQTAYGVLKDVQKPVKFWYIASIMHAAWLFGLMGSIVGLLLLFLFKSYHFHWESTLLSDAHFYQLLHILGFLPAKFGITLPDGMHSQPAHFAWLTIACLMIYGVLPRLMAYLYSRIKSRISFRIDIQDPYFARLLAYYNQSIIDQDDYQPPKPKPLPQVAVSDRLIIAALEKPNHTPLALTALKDFGCVDDQDDIQRLLTDADQNTAQICLVINTDTVPDRGILRKIERIGTHPYGIFAVLVGDAQRHQTAWQDALADRHIAVLDLKL